MARDGEAASDAELWERVTQPRLIAPSAPGPVGSDRSTPETDETRRAEALRSFVRLIVRSHDPEADEPYLA